MTKKQTEKSKYPSRYSPKKFVHAAQYITELICEKSAKIKGKELPIKFWELKEWKQFFKQQTVIANRLIKEYGEHAIISALMDKRSYKTYSLRSPVLHDIIKEYKNKEETSKKILKEIDYNFSEKKTFDSSNNVKTNLSKLKDLDI